MTRLMVKKAVKVKWKELKKINVINFIGLSKTVLTIFLIFIMTKMLTFVYI